jgi:AbrB family looped-hinge helix DNA binding protein
LIVSHDINLSRHVDRVVAIRDGKVSSETLRHKRSGAGGDAADHATTFTELIVLDSAGRLQIPKDLREQLGIQRYVRMELVEDGILIRPAEDHTTHEHGIKELAFDEMTATQSTNRLQQFFQRWLPKRRSKS